jgi:hypothetical protein
MRGNEAPGSGSPQTILITQGELVDYGGSEMVTLELAEYLSGLGMVRPCSEGESIRNVDGADGFANMPPSCRPAGFGWRDLHHTLHHDFL